MSRVSNFMSSLMNWLKFEAHLTEATSPEAPADDDRTTLLYLKPEALRHVVVVNDLEKYQSSEEFVEGGRLVEVSRQYSYRLRQIADLTEEPIQPEKRAPVRSLPTTRPGKPELRVATNDELSLASEIR